MNCIIHREAKYILKLAFLAVFRMILFRRSWLMMIIFLIVGLTLFCYFRFKAVMTLGSENTMSGSGNINHRCSILLYSFKFKTVAYSHKLCDVRQIDMTDVHGQPSNNFSRKDRQRMMSNLLRENILKSITGYQVIIFHSKDLPRRVVLENASCKRSPGQIWAYYNKESPYNTANLSHKRYDNLFNMTITPMRKSDIFVPYGYYRKKSSEKAYWMKIFYNGVLFESEFYKSNDTLLYEELNLMNNVTNFAEKDLLVAWVATHCGTPRDTLVAALLRYIPIHIYGPCGYKFGQRKTCERNSIDCEKKLRRYKFALAFENSFCVDYVSEKYWNAIFRGNIPIVYGGSNYDSAVAIPKSFIDTRKFKSIRYLADYIIKLTEEKAEYEKYFEWRKLYQVNYKPNDRHRLEIVAPKICKLVREKQKWNSYDLSEFYNREQNCPLQKSIERSIM